MNKKELEFSKLLLNMSNTILEYFKQNGLKNSVIKEQNNEKDNIILEEQEQEQEQEQFINVDNSKVELVSSQKEQKSIIPLLIGGWILYKILK